jgi:ABC-2 type transport system ATP-binding protein
VVRLEEAMKPAIEAHDLTRRYGSFTAVDDLSFAVDEGEIFGFLGPNGAGKTTTIKMLTGRLRPTTGSARVADCDVVTERDQLKPRIGVVFEHQNLYERLSGRENLAFFAQLYGVGSAQVNRALEQVKMTDRASESVGKYSNGMRQRILIARALLHRPRVLFLDEPTRGLDPAVAREIRGLVSELASEGVTVFLTTHYMEEADQLCRRVGIIDSGKLVALDTPERLKAQHSSRRVSYTLADGSTSSLSLDDPADGRRLGELVASGQVSSLHSAEPTLEEVFLQHTGKRLLE